MNKMFDLLPQTLDELHLSCGNCGCFYHKGNCYGLYLIGNMVKACDCIKPKLAKIIFRLELLEPQLNVNQLSKTESTIKPSITTKDREYKPFKLPWE